MNQRGSDSAADVVKSAARVLEVLEFFAEHREPASVSDICNALRYPQSSTSVLVRSLTTLGYLGALPGRRYYPTARVGLLGDWIKQDWAAIATRLCNESGETVVAAQLNGAQGQFISMLDGRTPLPGRPSIGATFALDTSAMGVMLLSALSDADALKLVAAGSGTEGSAIRSALTHARQDGYCASDDDATEPFAMVAVLGTRPMSPVPVAIAVCVGAERWPAERSRLTEIVRRSITRAA